MVAQVYVEFPEVIFVDQWASKAEEMNFTEEEITCVLDTVSHSLISAISNTQPGKDWSKKASHEIEICLRKLASVHPTLLLRYKSISYSFITTTATKKPGIKL